MKIKINSKDTNLSIPVPLSLASTCIRLIPNKEISKEDKKTILAMIKYCKKELKNYKGLEVVNITSEDGDKVKIIV